MLIPQVSIRIRLSNHAAGQLLAPRYVVPVLRRFLGPKLDRGAAGNGIEAVEADPATPVHREVFSVESEAAFWRGLYGSAWDDTWTPDAFRNAVRELLEEDAARVAALEARGALSSKPHASFTKAGVSAAAAVACQAGGYPTLNSLPTDLLEIAQIQGVDTTTATLLLAARLKQQTAADALPAPAKHPLGTTDGAAATPNPG